MDFWGGLARTCGAISCRPNKSSWHRKSVPMSPIKRACFSVAVLFPMAAYGSFGGAPCRDDFACHFFTWGVLVGAVGIPISALIFAVLHLGVCNPARSKLRQFFLGGFIGMVAYELSAAFGALIGSRATVAPGKHTEYLLIGFFSAYVVLAIVSALYARSSPRQYLRRDGGNAG